MPAYEEEFMRQTVAMKHKNRSVIPSSNQRVFKDEEKAWEYRSIDVEKFPFKMDITITDKRVIISSVQEKTAIGVVIIHDEIIRNFKILFEVLWSIGKPDAV